MAERGNGPCVLLLHSSVSGNRQWSKLAAALEGRYRVVAPNLYGYGQTSSWPGRARQTLDDQAALAEAAIGARDGPIAVVGHSFGSAVAMKVAVRLGAAVDRLVVIEPNPFYLLRAAGRRKAFAEIDEIRRAMQRAGATGDFASVAPRFCDYWVGDGAWAALSDERRAAFIAAMPPNVHEWDAVMGEPTPLQGWSAITAQTLLLTCEDPKRPVRELVDLLAGAFPAWRRASYGGGGHMAPLTRPDAVNPIICAFLDGPKT